MGDTAINDKVDEGLNYVIGDRMAHLIYMKEIAEGPPLREVFAESIQTSPAMGVLGGDEGLPCIVAAPVLPTVNPGWVVPLKLP